MTEPAAIIGQLVDAKNIAVHKSMRLSIDVPAERGAEIVKLFGWPTMANPVPVAVARLTEPAQIEAQAEPTLAANGNGKKVWREYSPAQQAGILCNDPPFWKFLTEVGGANVTDEAGAASYVRLACHVHSRSELNVKPISRRLWFDIDSKYQAWLQVPVE